LIPLNVILTVGGLQQGYAKGTNLPTVGQIEVSWYSPVPEPPKAAPLEQSAPVETGGGVKGGGSALVDKGAAEEEAVAIGWGDDGEDGMGML
jgi:RNA-binding protein 26